MPRPGWSRGRLLAAAGVLFAVALLASAALLLDLRDPPPLLLFVGRFHPMVVHFPIALLLLVALLEAASLLAPLRALRDATPVILLLGTVGAAVAVVAGVLLSLEGGYDEEAVDPHRWLGVSVAVAAACATALRLREMRRPSPRLRALYGATLALTVALLLAAGHRGGSLTHGPDYLTHHLPAPVKQMAGLAEAPASRIVDIDSAVVYADLVAPVLEARCVSCHGPSRERGGLRLDSYDALMDGGDGGAVVVAGDPEESELLRRIVLPPADEDAMPPDGARPLDIGETELIRWWIANGASSRQRVAEVREVPTAVATLFRRVAPPRPEPREGLYALDAPPADPAALAALKRAGLGVDPVARDVPLLRVSTAGRRATFGDADLRKLGPVARQVTWLDLGRTRVSDAGLAAVAAMPNLTRLHLEQTAVSDAGLRHLHRLQRLEYLNLYGTQVTDEGIRQLEALPGLRAVYLWQTRVTEEGVERLRGKRPDLRVVVGVETALER